MNRRFAKECLLFLIIPLSLSCKGGKPMANEPKSKGSIIMENNNDRAKRRPEEKGLFLIRWQLESKGDEAVAYYLNGKRYVGDKGLVKLFHELEQTECSRILIEYSDGVSDLDKNLPFPVSDEQTLKKVKMIVKEKLKCKVVIRKLKQELPKEPW